MKTFRSFLDAASVNAFHRLNLSKHTAPKEPMHDVTSDEKKTGNKKAVKVSQKKLSEGKVKVKLNPEKEIGYTVHDVGPGGKKTLVKSGKTKVKDIEEGWVALGPKGASSVYDKFGDVRAGTKWYGRKAPVNKPGDAEPGAEDTYNNSKQGGERNRNARSLKKEETINEISHKLALRAMKKSEKRADDEYEADQAYDRLSDYKTHEDRAKRLRGHMRKKFGNDKPGRGSADTDRLSDQGGDGRLGVYSVNTHGKRAGLPPKEQVNRLKGNIKFSLGKHHKPNLPEETQINELSKNTLKSYIRKASSDRVVRSQSLDSLSQAAGDRGYAKKSEIDQGGKLLKKMGNRRDGIDKALNRLEETQIDEISQQLTGRYRSLASTDLAHRTSKALRDYQADKPVDKKNRKKSLNRVAGIRRADKRFKSLDEVSAGLAVRATHHAYVKSDQMKKDAQKEPDMHSYVQAVHKAEKKSKQGIRFAKYAAKKMEEEQIDELSYDTVARYHRKAAERFHTGEEPEGKRKKGREMATRKRAGGMMGIPKAKVMAKEETQLDELYGKGKLDSIVLAHANAAHKSLRKAREQWRNPTGVLDKAKEHTLDSSKHQILVNRGRAMKHGKYRGADAKTWKAISRMQKEESQLDEISQKTKLSYINKSDHESNPEKKQGSFKNPLNKRKQWNRFMGRMRATNPKDARDIDGYEYQEDRRKRERDKKD